MFRTGTTSYIIPADILPNVEFLAPRVDDVQLVLFETDEYGSNLPDAALRRRLNELAAEHGLTYTVHLPLDLRLGDGDEETHISLVKARRVIEATRELRPFAYTVHLTPPPPLMNLSPNPSPTRGGERRSPPSPPSLAGKGAGGLGALAGRGPKDGSLQPTNGAFARWQDDARHALEIVCSWLDEPERLCVENLERWDPEAFAPIVEALPVSRTIDIGHLWLQGADPLAHLARWIGRARVVHLHGIAGRDHASLAHVPADRLDPVIALLADRFSGVLTLEVFNRADLESSQAALAAAMGRIGAGASDCGRTRPLSGD